MNPTLSDDKQFVITTGSRSVKDYVNGLTSSKAVLQVQVDKLQAEIDERNARIANIQKSMTKIDVDLASMQTQGVDVAAIQAQLDLIPKEQVTQ